MLVFGIAYVEITPRIDCKCQCTKMDISIKIDISGLEIISNF